jgi:hypothetical protein
MWPYLVNLLSRSWSALLGAMGTTTLAIVVGLVTPLLVLFLNLVFKLGKDGWKWSVTVAHFSQNLKGSIAPTLIGTGVLWAALLSWFVVQTTYKDHQSLVALESVPKTEPGKPRISLKSIPLRAQGIALAKDILFFIEESSKDSRAATNFFDSAATEEADRRGLATDTSAQFVGYTVEQYKKRFGGSVDKFLLEMKNEGYADPMTVGRCQSVNNPWSIRNCASIIRELAEKVP